MNSVWSLKIELVASWLFVVGSVITGIGLWRAANMVGWRPDRARLYYKRDIMGLNRGTFGPRMGPIPKFCFKNAWDAVIFGCKWLGFNGLHVPFCVGQG